MADVQTYVKKKTDSLMSTEVNRAEFLRYAGVAILSVLGVKSFMKNLQDAAPKQHSSAKVAKKGYGGSAYGV